MNKDLKLWEQHVLVGWQSNENLDASKDNHFEEQFSHI